MIDVFQDGSRFCVILQLCYDDDEIQYRHWIIIGRWHDTLEAAQASANEYRQGK